MPSNPPTPPPKNPTSSLADLKRRLSQAQEVVVGPDGKLHTPSDPQVATMASNEKTVLKPQRWF